jgi:amino acid transporter
VHQVFHPTCNLGFALLVWIWPQWDFLQNLTLSVVSRLITYGLVCAALPVLRSRDGQPGGVAAAAFRLPAGAIFAGLGVLGMVIVATQVSAREAKIMAVVMGLATLHYWVNRKR